MRAHVGVSMAAFALEREEEFMSKETNQAGRKDPFIREVTRMAPAKVNLFLRMDGKREDGYHLLYSCMQTISIYDEITVRLREKDPSDGKDPSVTVVSDSSVLPKDPFKNTAFLAAYRFLQKYGADKYAVEVSLTKNIPSQAGLGGGSSDAASVLLAMADLLPEKVSDEDLQAVASSIGADVPFFLFGGTSLCEGVGEIVTKLPDLKGLPMLLLKPKRGVSTPACYKAFDETGASCITEEEKKILIGKLQVPEEPSDRLVHASADWSNDLQAAALLAVPEIEEGIRLLSDGGAVFSAMSGSGSAVFGIFETEEKIRRIEESREFQKLISEGWWAQEAETI